MSEPDDYNPSDIENIVDIHDSNDVGDSGQCYPGI